MRFIVRPASITDADEIAAAHLDSIHTLGARSYSPQVLAVWGAPRDGAPYRASMVTGEVFFVACAEVPAAEIRASRLLGFSSHRVAAGQHRIAVYVRGSAARAGVGTALFNAVEAVARLQGASEIHVDASLLAVEFYRAQGFQELGAGQHWMRGIAMECAFMKKML